MDELQKRLEGYLDAVEASAGTAGEFVAEQTPLVAQEYLAWVFWQGTLIGVACGVVAVALLVPVKRVYRKLNEELQMGEPAVVVMVFTAGCLLCAATVSGMQVLKVCVAPRLVLLEKLAELIP